jgi:type II secretion system protein G
MTKIKKINKGFTLIELLIVIAIIGVLATLLMANFIGVRQRARDAQRKSDARQIQAALEIYRSDNQAYPPVGSGDGNLPGTTSCKASLKSPDHNSTYMASIPCDPTGGSYIYTYPYPNPTSAGYKLVACLENGSDSQKDLSGKDASCPAAANASFTVYSP